MSLDNENHIERACIVFPRWSDLLWETHNKLLAIIPNYSIVQIDEKFGALRYWYSPPGDLWCTEELEAYQGFGSLTSTEVSEHHIYLRNLADRVVWEAERKSVDINAL